VFAPSNFLFFCCIVCSLKQDALANHLLVSRACERSLSHHFTFTGRLIVNFLRWGHCDSTGGERIFHIGCFEAVVRLRICLRVNVTLYLCYIIFILKRLALPGLYRSLQHGTNDDITCCSTHLSGVSGSSVLYRSLVIPSWMKVDFHCRISFAVKGNLCYVIICLG